jgi:glutathione S-transferase
MDQPARPAGPRISSEDNMLVIYHVEGRRSERIVWFCEEVGLAYDLKFEPGDMAASLQAARDVNPLMPMFPTVVYEGEILVESAAILQLLYERHGDGRLAPSATSADYPKYLQWLHFAESSAAPRMITEFLLQRAAPGEMPPLLKGQMGRSAQVLRYLEDYLSAHPYFGGPAFSLADIMMHFDVNFASMVAKVDMSPYPRVNAWFADVEARPAFKRMRAVSLPNGFIGVPA